MGHFALGYITGKLAAKIVKCEVNIPLILTLSILPDIDILIPFFEHRGPTHSTVIGALVFLPLFLMWGRKALPYFIALTQHSLLGDFLIGGEVQLLWPITPEFYGITWLGIKSVANVAFEWTLFTVFIIVLFKSRDLQVLFKPHSSNLLLTIPLITVVLPTFLEYPLDVPLLLIPPHLFFIILFAISVLIDLFKVEIT